MGIDLKAYVFPPATPDYSAADIVRKIKGDLSAQKNQQKQGLITLGLVNVTYYAGEVNSWAVSDLIEFPYSYSERPMFSWGIEGTYTGDSTNPTPYAAPDIGNPTYSKELPVALLSYINRNDYTTFSPAIFVPRIIHWYKVGTVWKGCYLLIYQVNVNCTEVDNKLCRLHFRFEGPGYL
jgi:hypothetical protein